MTSLGFRNLSTMQGAKLVLEHMRDFGLLLLCEGPLQDLELGK
jgi:hypothetical protein